ncbi:thiol-disulfide oxidoreductase DCC family protein [Adhaeribacter swui]|uniref:Thiol-disulfide oxidoreductase DCC family protein n=1 Tax=Adhaeribacter swui TaxID=2086471 RepID=A0A7G7G8Q9_9BACT|nr:thiol-disulfide oxidoreductase DCC family protein [Adhaeribacter swui]QNF33543.1 thiol-disulfide oxidoreductase DCC family protein [Adhaeribacter swui]
MQVFNPPIILFDGVCNLCNSFVQFVIKNDRRGYFKFTALQSEAGKEVLQQVHYSDFSLSTVVLVENGKVYVRSAAALKILSRLDGLWPLAYSFIILPTFLRDFIYKGIAQNRYRWFGKQESCMLPTPELKARFL